MFKSEPFTRDFVILQFQHRCANIEQYTDVGFLVDEHLDHVEGAIWLGAQDLLILATENALENVSIGVLLSTGVQLCDG